MAEWFSVGVTSEGILSVIEKINQYRNKNKDHVCLALRLIDSFIAQWYNDYVTISSKTIGLEGKTLAETNDIYQKLYAFAKRIVYHRLEQECKNYLVNGLYEGYHASGNSKFRDIVEQMGGISYVRDLAESIELFDMSAYGGKEKWISRVIEQRKWDISAEEVTSTLNNLRDLSERVRRLTTTMRENLNCQPAVTDKLYEELKN